MAAAQEERDVTCRSFVVACVWVGLDFVSVAERCSGGCYLPEEEEESERQRKEEDKKDSLPFGSFFHTNDPFFAILD
jgi:hypothetical protein